MMLSDGLCWFFEVLYEICFGKFKVAEGLAALFLLPSFAVSFFPLMVSSNSLFQPFNEVACLVDDE